MHGRERGYGGGGAGPSRDDRRYVPDRYTRDDPRDFRDPRDFGGRGGGGAGGRYGGADGYHPGRDGPASGHRSGGGYAAEYPPSSYAPSPRGPSRADSRIVLRKWDYSRRPTPRTEQERQDLERERELWEARELARYERMQAAAAYDYHGRPPHPRDRDMYPPPAGGAYGERPLPASSASSYRRSRSPPPSAADPMMQQRRSSSGRISAADAADIRDRDRDRDRDRERERDRDRDRDRDREREIELERMGPRGGYPPVEPGYVGHPTSYDAGWETPHRGTSPPRGPSARERDLDRERGGFTSTPPTGPRAGGYGRRGVHPPGPSHYGTPSSSSRGGTYTPGSDRERDRDREGSGSAAGGGYFSPSNGRFGRSARDGPLPPAPLGGASAGAGGGYRSGAPPTPLSGRARRDYAGMDSGYPTPMDEEHYRSQHPYHQQQHHQQRSRGSSPPHQHQRGYAGDGPSGMLSTGAAAVAGGPGSGLAADASPYSPSTGTPNPHAPHISRTSSSQTPAGQPASSAAAAASGAAASGAGGAGGTGTSPAAGTGLDATPPTKTARFSAAFKLCPELDAELQTLEATRSAFLSNFFFGDPRSEARRNLAQLRDKDLALAAAKTRVASTVKSLETAKETADAYSLAENRKEDSQALLDALYGAPSARVGAVTGVVGRPNAAVSDSTSA